jgi:acetoacetyl-CoA synthetase
MAATAGEACWTPAESRVRDSHLRRFADFSALRWRREFPDYRSLHRWSVEQPQQFWPSLAAFAGVQFQRRESAALVDAEAMPGARWFDGARLNFAENLLRFRDGHPALVFRDEAGRRRQLSYADLHREVGRVASGLAALGVGAGDRVAGLLPNCPEAIIAMLATTSLGAAWSSCSPDFGPAGVLDRFGQVAPRVLIAADSYRYAGKLIDVMPTVAAVRGGLPGLAATVLVSFLGDDRPLPAGTLGWAELGTAGTAPSFASLPFDQPLYVLFSSGTTGQPKCIVHGAGGTLLQHLKELLLHTDLRRGDRLFFFTTCGWMMWNWLVSGLACGATLVLYDGSPFHPDADALWRLAEEEGVTVFGASPKYLSAVEKAGRRPGSNHDLAALRTILSTGSPLAPEGFDFVYAAVKGDVQLASISGGTDIVSCFVLGNPWLPVRRGEIQCAGLGMAVEIVDEGGQPLPAGRGQLVCARPFPSMPIGFLHDASGERYHAAYFEQFPGAWAHGDYAERTASGGFIIHGRSDAVLNPGGVRIGTAELYRQVERLPEILESLAVGQHWQGEERVVLFVVLREGFALDDAFRDRIRREIRAGLTPRHVPAKIVQVAELPRTRSGKLPELAVRAVIHGQPVHNVESLANPAALDHFRDLAELQEFGDS